MSRAARARSQSMSAKASGGVASLNPNNEEDEQAVSLALRDDSLRETLELSWLAVLHSGTCLRNDRCDEKHFKTFAIACKYGNSERHLNTALRCFDGQQEGDEWIDFRGFVRCLFYLGMDRFRTDNREVALKKMVSTHVTPWLEAYTRANEHIGTGPDELLVDLPDIDRFLYVYDAVLDRLFHRYCDLDQHGNRELTLEQLKTLDTFVELDEMKEFCKDFNFFPRVLSHVEISRCSQWSCFGRINVDPTRQGAGRHSLIQQAKAEPTSTVGVPLPAFVAPGSESQSPLVAHCPNPLFVPTLPPEFLHDEVLLDKPRFMTCFLRLAQCLVAKDPALSRRLPSICSRVEEMVAQMAPTYEKMFGRTMDADCDWTEKGVPVLLNQSPTASLAPAEGAMAGGFELHISGTNWCEKRGVFVRFGEGDNAVVVRAKSITKKKIIVQAPEMQPKDTTVQVRFQHGQYVVELVRVTRVPIECSNNRWQYSSTEPPQRLEFRVPLQPLIIDEATSAKMMKLFGAVCAINDRYNTKYLRRDKWRRLKALFGLSEAPAEGGIDNDVYFLEMAEFHEGQSDLSLHFKGYLRVLARTLYASTPDLWSWTLLSLAEKTLDVEKSQIEVVQRLQEDELTVARRAIELVERRPQVELDIFLGPVLCGTLTNRPGDVTSQCTGPSVPMRRSHPFLSYTHWEVNTESIVMGHIRVADSVVHLMNRLLQNGFDVSCRHSSPSACKPAGRCWSITTAQGQRIGAVWDYQGSYSCLHWQPAEQDLAHRSLTMSYYHEDSRDDFVILYIVLTKAKDIAHLRTLLAARGYTLTTRLYKLP